MGLLLLSGTVPFILALMDTINPLGRMEKRIFCTFVLYAY